MMDLIYHPVFLEHDTGTHHPENHKRLEPFRHLSPSEIMSGEAYLPLVHEAAYIERVRHASRVGAHLDPDTVTSPGSYPAACYAAGATLQAAEQGGFALVRPPGHHAYPGYASGFCLFNNIAIAAMYLANQGKRVLILDFDGHLGDGTSEIFYRSDKVLYWSLHQYPAFPGSGYSDEIGEGKGEGFTFNIPLPPGSADDIFLDAFEHFLPAARQFSPDVVAVSAGFDAHLYDLLLDLRVSTHTYFHIGRRLREFFPRIFATLEGGYNIQELFRGVESFMAGINGAENPHIQEKTNSGMRVWETYEMYLHAALGKLQKYWTF